MNYRINSKAVILVVLLVVVAVALFAYTLVSAPTAVPEEGGALDNSLPADAQLITGQYQYRGGIHTIAGTVDLPSPCHKLDVVPFFTEPEQKVELRFTTTVGEEGCAAVVTPTPFKVTFEGPDNIAITAVWNGVPARLNLIPVGPDGSIDDPMYVKG